MPFIYLLIFNFLLSFARCSATTLPASITHSKTAIAHVTQALKTHHINAQVEDSVPTISPFYGQPSNQNDVDKRPLCPQFTVTYFAVHTATYFLIHENRAARRKYKVCIASTNITICNDERKHGFALSTNQCLSAHSFGACFVAIGIIGRLDWIRFSCIPYIKSSTVGNCYVREYLTMNNFVTKKTNLLFHRESGVYNNKTFQCSAGGPFLRRRRRRRRRNRLPCRVRFRYVTFRIVRVHQCALPRQTIAYVRYGACLARARTRLRRLRCYQRLTFRVNRAYIRCTARHGILAVAIASLSIGGGAVDCPAFRRDAWVGPCKADDYIQLSRLELLITHSNGSLEFRRKGLCRYRK